MRVALTQPALADVLQQNSAFRQIEVLKERAPVPPPPVQLHRRRAALPVEEAVPPRPGLATLMAEGGPEEQVEFDPAGPAGWQAVRILTVNVLSWHPN